MKTLMPLTQYQEKVLFDSLESVRKVYEDEPEVFAFIVRAVRCHDELLLAAKGARNVLSALAVGILTHVKRDSHALAALRTAIAKAEAKQ